MTLIRFSALLAAAWIALSPAAADAQGAGTSASGQAVNPDGQTVLEFKKRLDDYVALRNQADNTTPAMKTTGEASHIMSAQLELAERIGAARKDARRGDIFTPAITAMFRKLLHSEVKQEPGTRALITDDNPGPGAVPFKINGQYPDKEPLSTVPPNVLDTLPPLPKDIEYRFVSKHLILRDVKANLIIDYLLNAIP